MEFLATFIVPSVFFDQGAEETISRNSPSLVSMIRLPNNSLILVVRSDPSQKVCSAFFFELRNGQWRLRVDLPRKVCMPSIQRTLVKETFCLEAAGRGKTAGITPVPTGITKTT